MEDDEHELEVNVPQRTPSVPKQMQPKNLALILRKDLNIMQNDLLALVNECERNEREK